ncbi:MAG: hypothetical protein ACKERG_03445 [Candidatus Hodgkinia cicadicola]
MLNYALGSKRLVRRFVSKDECFNRIMESGRPCYAAIKLSPTDGTQTSECECDRSGRIGGSAGDRLWIEDLRYFASVDNGAHLQLNTLNRSVDCSRQSWLRL